MLQFMKAVAELECEDALAVLFRTNPQAFARLEKDRDFQNEVKKLDLAEREQRILAYGAFDVEDTADRQIDAAQPANAGTGFTPSDRLDQGNSEALAGVTGDQLARDRHNEIADQPAPEQGSDRRLRPWQHGKVRFSNKSYYGGPFAGRLADGREHLVPERHFVEAVVATHSAGNQGILQSQGVRWWEQIENAALEDPTFGPVLKSACEHYKELQEENADLDNIWMGHSFGIRDALQRALARRAHQMLELTEATDTVANAGNSPADWMTTRLERTKEFYDRAKLEAGYWMRIWREERERAYSMEKMAREALHAKDPSFDPTPTANADPDAIEIDYAVTRHLIQWAQYQERDMETDPRSMATQAASHERYLSIAL